MFTYVQYALQHLSELYMRWAESKRARPVMRVDSGDGQCYSAERACYPRVVRFPRTRLNGRPLTGPPFITNSTTTTIPAFARFPSTPEIASEYGLVRWNKDPLEDPESGSAGHNAGGGNCRQACHLHSGDTCTRSGTGPHDIPILHPITPIDLTLPLKPDAAGQVEEHLKEKGDLGARRGLDEGDEQAGQGAGGGDGGEDRVDADWLDKPLRATGAVITRINVETSSGAGAAAGNSGAVAQVDEGGGSQLGGDDEKGEQEKTVRESEDGEREGQGREETEKEEGEGGEIHEGDGGGDTLETSGLGERGVGKAETWEREGDRERRGAREGDAHARREGQREARAAQRGEKEGARSVGEQRTR